MRIGIEAQRIFREHKHGMDFVALELIRNLQELDKENEYFIFVQAGPDDQVIQETANFKIISLKGAFPIIEQILIPWQARRLKLDLLHFTSNTAPLWPGTKLVLTLHDIIFMERKGFFTSGYTLYQAFGNWYRRLLLPRILGKLSRIITVSSYEQKVIADFFPNLNSEDITVIHNGYSRHFKPIDDLEHLRAVQEAYNLPDKYILFLGNTDPKKNSPRVIQAFAQLCQEKGCEYKLVVADLDAAIIEDYLHEVNLEEQITNFHITNYVRNQDLPAIMNKAHLFLYPSLRESFGIPLLEAMACACPVITGNSSSLPEIAQDAALQVDVREESNIKEAIELVLNDVQLRQRLIERGLKRCQDFNWLSTAKHTLALYQSMQT